MTKIILATLINDDFCRLRTLGQNTISCGLFSLIGNLAKHNAGVDFDLTLVINRKLADNENEEIKRKIEICDHLPQEYDFIKQVLHHNNQGSDLGAYDAGYQYLKASDYDGDVLFMNTSLSGPSQDYWLLKYHTLFHKHQDVGLCGISLNSHDTNIINNPPFKPHVQSFFLYTTMKALKKVFPANLDGYNSQNKLEIIENGEIGMSQRILDAGYSIVCYNFPFFFYKSGMEWIIPLGDLRGFKEYRELANKI